MNLSLRFILLSSFFACEEINESGAIQSDFRECDYINEKVKNYDMFQDYVSITLNHGYTPDIDKRDSIMNDYHFLKFKNSNLNGIYVIVDANTRYRTNKVIPFDELSKKEYPFTLDLVNEGACIFLDQIKTEQCECI
tara:strand:+ start:624 stop:1034 length:411 start_codon:yes stop_codon:yes gene_type:complete